jgi:hypothetical protein
MTETRFVKAQNTDEAIHGKKDIEKSRTSTGRYQRSTSEGLSSGEHSCSAAIVFAARSAQPVDGIVEAGDFQSGD